MPAERTGPVPDPWPVQTPVMTDLQYVVYVCKLSVEAAAHHTGQNPAKIRAELTKCGPPPGFSTDDLLAFDQQ